MSDADIEAQLNAFAGRFRELVTEIQRSIVGYEDVITEVLTAIFSQGHVLLEGVPGLGKTSLVKVLSQVLDLSFGRIQCTPDLMPADIIGTHIVVDDGQGSKSFRFEKGPVFTHLLLVDEINRATPKTQAALLEVMQERAVTTGGETHIMPKPFFVMATQNPLEMEGTYPLPEAQLDRFLFKLLVPFPSQDQLVEISRRTTSGQTLQVDCKITGEELEALQHLIPQVPIADPLTSYAASLVLATHPDQDQAPEQVKRYVNYGSSPRGMQALIRGAKVRALLDGRTAVSIEDVQRVAPPALRHRIILNFEGEAESISSDNMIEEILTRTPTPAALGAA